MRSRIVLLLVLAVAIAVVAVYLGWSTSTPKAAGEPSTATTAGAPVGSAHKPTSGSGPARSPRASSQQTGQTMGRPKAAPPKASTPKAAPPKGPTPEACAPTAAAQPPAHTKVSDPPPASAADRVHFGQVSTTSVNEAQIEISEDHRALSTGFENFVIETRKGSGECDVTRSASMRLPVTGPAQAARAHLYAQGYVWTDRGASARVTVHVNGQVKVTSFPPGSDRAFVAGLEFPVTPGVTYTLSVQLEVHQNPDTGGEAYINVLSIEGGVT